MAITIKDIKKHNFKSFKIMNKISVYLFRFYLQAVTGTSVVTETFVSPLKLTGLKGR